MKTDFSIQRINLLLRKDWIENKKKLAYGVLVILGVLFFFLLSSAIPHLLRTDKHNCRRIAPRTAVRAEAASGAVRTSAALDSVRPCCAALPAAPCSESFSAAGCS